MFRFKQFTVDQSNCAMKINTDGVLLGSMVEAVNAKTILDIGTGTGVIALMLAQRFREAQIDAVEIDLEAAQTAGRNFANSPFSGRLRLFVADFGVYFDQNPSTRYDLVATNPPFYTGSLKSPLKWKNLAKHTSIDFFEKLLKNVSAHLNAAGAFWLIIPADIAAIITDMASGHNLFLQRQVNIRSFNDSAPHRVILCFGFGNVSTQLYDFEIYNMPGVYSDVYQKLLRPYFIVF